VSEGDIMTNPEEQSLNSQVSELVQEAVMEQVENVLEIRAEQLGITFKDMIARLRRRQALRER
jgi:hypothetical protein